MRKKLSHIHLWSSSQLMNIGYPLGLYSLLVFYTRSQAGMGDSYGDQNPRSPNLCPEPPASPSLPHSQVIPQNAMQVSPP